MAFIQNLSIQVLPLNIENTYTYIDKAIDVISKSRLPYKVTAFSTQVEGELSALQLLVKNIHKAMFSTGVEEVILNIQYRAKHNKDVYLTEKSGKFE